MLLHWKIGNIRMEWCSFVLAACAYTLVIQEREKNQKLHNRVQELENKLRESWWLLHT